MTDPLGDASPGRLFEDAANELARESTPSLGQFSHRLEDLRPSFPNYELIRFIGCGGMGAAVLLAKDLASSEEVALKILPEDIAGNLRVADRFEREAEVMRTLDHPHIVTMLDFGHSEIQDLYIVMEFIEGHTLAELLQDDPLPLDQAIDFFSQICTAIAYAHDIGIIHRDLKPANILIDHEGHLKVSDFGLAKWYQITQSMSQTSVAGTYGYIAPEQLGGKGKVDQCSDVYSLGVVLYQMVTGTLPVGAYRPPSVKNPAAEYMDDALAKALQPDPEDRFQSVHEFRSAIESRRSSKRRLGSPRVLGGLVAFFIAMAGSAMWQQTKQERHRVWSHFDSIGQAIPENGPHAIVWNPGSGEIALNLTLQDSPYQTYQLEPPSTPDPFLDNRLTLNEILPLFTKLSPDLLANRLINHASIKAIFRDGSETLSLTNSPWRDEISQKRFNLTTQLITSLHLKKQLHVSADKEGLKVSLPQCQTFAHYCESTDHLLLPNSRPPAQWNDAWETQALIKVALYELLRTNEAAPHPTLASAEAKSAEIVGWSLRSRREVITAILYDRRNLPKSSQIHPDHQLLASLLKR